MIHLTWGLNRARVWLDELPDWSYQINSQIEREFPARENTKIHARSGAVELFIPAGGRAHFGALGGIFTPGQPEFLEVQIYTSQEPGSLVEGSLVGSHDEVYTGLPLEYADGILKGITDVNAPVLLEAGRLRFFSAAHGAIGSSPWIFRVLGRVVVQVLALDPQVATDVRLLETIQSAVLQRTDP